MTASGWCSAKLVRAKSQKLRANSCPQIGITPTSFSTSTVSTITIASHGQPSRKHPSGPLLRHFLHPMQRIGSIWILPNGG